MERGKDISIYTVTVVISGENDEAETELQHWTIQQ